MCSLDTEARPDLIRFRAGDASLCKQALETILQSQIGAGLPQVKHEQSRAITQGDLYRAQRLGHSLLSPFLVERGQDDVGEPHRLVSHRAGRWIVQADDIESTGVDFIVKGIAGQTTQFKRGKAQLHPGPKEIANLFPSSAHPVAGQREIRHVMLL